MCKSNAFTQASVELDDSDRHRVAFVDDCVVPELCYPALCCPVLGSGVHEPVVDVHGDDGRAVGIDALLESISFSL